MVEKSGSSRGNQFTAPGPAWHLSSSDKARTPWEIPLCGDLTDRQPELLSRLVEVPPNSRGILYFDSCGGSVYTGLALATIIRSRALQVTGLVVGECSSAALLSFAACRRRFVTSQATLLFHPMRWQSETDVRLEEATEWARHFQLLETELDQLLAQLFDLAPETLSQWTRPGRFVTGPELASTGLARLVDPFAAQNIWQQIRGTD
ncbi:MAG: ATP-dependent Clp protease proteolytic subunit [Planctomycetaceae bacterium]|nr:ATP-dependent Clp protease proteolytic subunit [Planctomycetaceae bacterium]